MKQRREYEKSFKEEAVKLAEETSASKAARDLEIAENTLRQWVTKAKKQPYNPFIGSGNKYISPQDAEKVSLMKENRELKRANEILKEALGFFVEGWKKQKQACCMSL